MHFKFVGSKLQNIRPKANEQVVLANRSGVLLVFLNANPRIRSSKALFSHFFFYLLARVDSRRGSRSETD